MSGKTISLNGEWSLAYAPEGEWRRGGVPFPEDAPEIAARVPGNVELDLCAAGLEADPFFGLNLYAYEKYEYYMWRYRKTFFVPEGFAPEEAVLRLGGVNTYARITLNGSPVGETDNMLIAWEFEVGGLLRRGEENTLEVVIRSAANRAREEDFPAGASGDDGSVEYVWQRKPPHSFGWDIMPRFPSAGLWRDVTLSQRGRTRITQAYYATLAVDESGADLLCKWRFTTDAGAIAGFRVRLEGSWISSGYELDEHTFEAEAEPRFPAGEFRVHIPNAKTWWPRGYGEANLYEVTLTLLRDGREVDRRREHIGLRTARVEHKMAPGDAGEFAVVVNGVRIMAKGTNWVPLDAFHSRDAARLPQAHALLCEAGCNIVRCWGGNVYEDHAFFDLCDREGVLVWQDFSMACASYPQEERFYDMIRREAKAVGREYRNHASLLLWAGDNEVDQILDDGCRPQASRYNAVTRVVLPEVVRNEDPYRFYLPSSPYIDGGIGRYDVPEQHNWGARAWFKSEFYRDTRAHFVSECGYHGCPAPESLARFLPADRLWPIEGEEWRAHSTEHRPYVRGYDRNGLMQDQVRILFGRLPDTLEEFSFLSQAVQAEAKKLFIERTRIGKWRRTGVIWWNLLDGWPQISDAVVDYYFVKKRAFDAIRRAQRPLCLMLDELRDWTQDIVLGNDGPFAGQVRWRVVDGDSGRTLRAGLYEARPNENAVVGSLRVQPGEQKLYLLYCEAQGETYGNHYLAGFPPYDADRMSAWAGKIDRLP